MKKDNVPVRSVRSITELHRLLNLPQPQHPLISVIHLNQIQQSPRLNHDKLLYPFYQICLKQNYDGKLRYGQNYYDFDNGVLSFISPNQILSSEGAATDGWVLLIHPDFLHGYSLSKTIRNYGFFSYDLTEALFVSEKEQQMIETLLSAIQSEYQFSIDKHSQDIIITQLELLLHYADRFYQRQFITRKKVHTDLLTKLETILTAHFEHDNALNAGVPSVEFVASQLNVSPHYLSDMLRNSTGLNAQQHIQQKLIDKAKEILSTTNHSVAEIAYQLGFKYPQSFHKLFKSKTNLSPLQFRQSFN